MRKIVESTFVSLDGIIDDTRPSTASRAQPQHWGQPYWDAAHAGYAQKLMDSGDAMLLGRVTYEGFAEAWSSRAGDPHADVMNAMPKYVASRTLTETTWNATLLQGDVAEEVAKLKEQPGRNILKWGTGELDRTLVQHGLVDEFHFWYFPVVVGAGKHLFEGAGFDTTHLKLADVERFDSGIVVHIYVPK
ncbi:dihydrofolate reductase family protein [Plantactinospora sp. KLBMP9567]|uniref:dihydrofolate reductase family protein n=1 Tax=Plantactinospora sp. KLBMP9567 TaxID=3085900 RepID=UPI00298254E3|nr:dihydrofolate reductase family protein [Plantactinospora sp. KLBMP9567]MDW5324744.1 dihydrofolate reductase family protein [Plantactinospora sp. KLBMP9567]